MRLYIKILLTIIIMAVIFKTISSGVTRMSISIKSISFDHSDDTLLRLGNKNTPVPNLGNGIYAVALNKTLSGVENRIMYIGVLRVDTYENQLKEMDMFFKRSILDGFSHIAIFSIGTTHEKPILEILRTGIASGILEDILYIFKNYGITKLTSFSHGVKKPYIFIKDVQNNKIIERTGIVGGKLIANL